MEGLRDDQLADSVMELPGFQLTLSLPRRFQCGKFFLIDQSLGASATGRWSLSPLMFRKSARKLHSRPNVEPSVGITLENVDKSHADDGRHVGTRTPDLYRVNDIFGTSVYSLVHL